MHRVLSRAGAQTPLLKYPPESPNTWKERGRDCLVWAGPDAVRGSQGPHGEASLPSCTINAANTGSLWEKVCSRPPGEAMLLFNSQVCDLLAVWDGVCFSVLLHMRAGSSDTLPVLGFSELLWFHGCRGKDCEHSSALQGKGAGLLSLGSLPGAPSPGAAPGCPWSVLLSGKRSWESLLSASPGHLLGQHISPTSPADPKARKGLFFLFLAENRWLRAKSPWRQNCGPCPALCRSSAGPLQGHLSFLCCTLPRQGRIK